MTMAGHQQCSYRYPNLLITVKHETDERSVTENYTNPRAYRSKNNYHSTIVYYNSNHRQKQHFNRPSPPPSSSSSTIQRRSQKNDRLYYHNQQPIRPLMEINDNQFSTHYDLNDNYTYKQREPKQRGQYRNRKAELDWDHAFDLDQIDLYTTQNDIDNYSLTSMNSSSENSFSSV